MPELHHQTQGKIESFLSDFCGIIKFYSFTSLILWKCGSIWGLVAELLWHSLPWIQKFWTLTLSSPISPLQLCVLWSECNVSPPCVHGGGCPLFQVSLWLRNTTKLTIRFIQYVSVCKKIVLSNIKN